MGKRKDKISAHMELRVNGERDKKRVLSDNDKCSEEKR